MVNFVVYILLQSFKKSLRDLVKKMKCNEYLGCSLLQKGEQTTEGELGDNVNKYMKNQVNRK